MINIIIAYATAIFGLLAVTAALASMAALMPIALLFRRASRAVYFITGVATSILTYWLGKYFFEWLDVNYAWYSYLISIFLFVLNEGRRVQGETDLSNGRETLHAQGVMLGIIASLTTHFLT